MIDNKDVEKIVEALTGIFATKKDLEVLATKEDLEVFPTAKMMNDSFETVATKVQVEKIDDRLKRVEDRVEKIDNRLQSVEEKLENMGDVRSRLKTIEEALEI